MHLPGLGHTEHLASAYIQEWSPRLVVTRQGVQEPRLLSGHSPSLHGSAPGKMSAVAHPAPGIQVSGPIQTPRGTSPGRSGTPFIATLAQSLVRAGKAGGRGEELNRPAPRPPWVSPSWPRPLFQSEITHDERCAACKRGAGLQPCGTCPCAYHLGCLDPPLKTPPKGVWLCPKCQQKALKRHEGVPWSGMLAIVHSCATHKTGEASLGAAPLPPGLGSFGTSGSWVGAGALRPELCRGTGTRGSGHFPSRGQASARPSCHCPAFSVPVKEEEKQKLLQRGSELRSEHQQLGERDRQLASAVKVRRGGRALPLEPGCGARAGRAGAAPGARLWSRSRAGGHCP
uniref:PHD-type domain-containing protein n=1 Tax=Oryctolagus cuniculus TaxID=9986 RepID=A0A5F9CIK0_RABIT